MKGKLSIYCIIFLLLVLPIFGLDQYEVAAPGTIVNMPSCGIFSQRIDITNTGTSVLKPNYRVEPQRVADWVTIVTESKLIAPSESTYITMFINAPCKQEGQYDLRLYIENTDNDKVLEQELKVYQEDNIRFNVASAIVNTCPCDPVSMKFTLTNPGPFAETYDIEATQFDDQLTIVPSTVQVLPGDTIDGLIVYESACDEYGVFNPEITIEARNSGSIAELPMQAVVNACYEFTIEAPDTVNACDMDLTVAEINITNTANIKNNYEFRLYDHANWITLSGDEISLFPKQNGFTEIHFAPINKAGQYLFGIEVESEIGGLIAQQEIALDVPICHAVDLDVTQFIDACQESLTIPIQVNNSGIFIEHYNISIDADEHVIFENGLQQQQVTVNPHSSLEVMVLANTYEMPLGTNGITVSIEQSNNKLVVDEKTFELLVQPNTQCYKVVIGPTEFDINRSSSQSYVNITNVGMKASTYNISLQAPAFMQAPFQEISLVPGESHIVTVTTEPTEDVEKGTHYGSLFVENQQISYKADLRFNLDKSRIGPLFWLLLLLVLLLLIIIIVVLLLLSSRESAHSDDFVDVTQVQDAPKEMKRSKETKVEKVIDEEVPPPTKRQEKGTSIWGILGWILLIIIILLLLGLFVWGAIKGVEYIKNTAANQTNQTIDANNQTEGVPPIVENATVDINDSQTNVDTSVDANQTYCGMICNVQQWWSGLFNKTEQPNTVENSTDGQVNQQNQTDQIDTSNTTVSERQQTINDINKILQTANASGRLQTFAYQVWDENSEHTLDLSQYFSDPDNETLVYVFNPVDEIEMKEEDGIVTFSPQDDFIGVRYTTFIARDPQGSFVRSPLVTLIVKPAEKTKDSFQMTFIVIGIIIALLLLVILSILQSRERY